MCATHPEEAIISKAEIEHMTDTEVTSVSVPEKERVEILPSRIARLLFFARQVSATAGLLVLLSSSIQREEANPYFSPQFTDETTTLELPEAWHNPALDTDDLRWERMSQPAQSRANALNESIAGVLVPPADETVLPEASIDDAADTLRQEPRFVHGGIRFVDPRPITLTFGQSLVSGVEFSFQGVEYQQGVSLAEFQQELFQPGQETAGITEDEHGNTIVYLHSGYIETNGVWIPLEAEPLRDAIEGGGEFSNWVSFTAAERDQHLEALVGSLLQVDWNGQSTPFTIEAAGYIPHVGVGAFDADTSQVLAETIRQTGGDDSSFAKLSDERVVVLVFCGWGPADHPESTTYSRYVLAVKPVEASMTAAEAAFARTPIDPDYAEFAAHMLNMSSNPGYGTALAEASSLVAPRFANPIIAQAFDEHEGFMIDTVRMFYPDATDAEVAEYLTNHPILLGPAVDEALIELSSGSWGTTIPTVRPDGTITFGSVSLYGPALQQQLVTTELVAQEFLQELQYNATFAALYNAGYLAEVASIDSPEMAFAQVRQANWRAFLEIIQVQFLYEQGITGNAYTFSVNGRVFNSEDTDSASQIAATFAALQEIIRTVTGRTLTAAELMDAQTLIEVNEAFRDYYTEHFDAQGVPSAERNIWNVAGMSRPGAANAAALSIEPQLILP